MVRIVTTDGEVMIDRFIEQTGKYITLSNRKIKNRYIRQFGIYKRHEE